MAGQGRPRGKSGLVIVSLVGLAAIVVALVAVGLNPLQSNLFQAASGVYDKASSTATRLATRAVDSLPLGVPAGVTDAPADPAAPPASPKPAPRTNGGAHSAPDAAATSDVAATTPTKDLPATPWPDLAAVPTIVASSVFVPDDPSTYSTADADVVPPVPYNEHLPAGLQLVPPGVRPDELVISYVVNQEGVVEAAKPLTRPNSLAESLVLADAISAVKSWTFDPATKDGRAVRFQQMVTLGRRQVVASDPNSNPAADPVLDPVLDPGFDQQPPN
jgi:hypothetical protein